jgi:HD-GYP domain-containing protein (c-di-GMP phosphodiesterase class II)
MTDTPPAGFTSRAEGYALATTLLRSLLAAWRAAAVYAENNTAYRQRRDELTTALAKLFGACSSCTITYQSDYIFFNGERLNYDREFSFGRSLANQFRELGLGAIAIPDGVPNAELDKALFTLASADRKIENRYAALAETWGNLGIGGITIAAQSSEDPSAFVDPRKIDQNVDPNTLRRRRAQALFRRSETVVKEFWERVRDRNSFEGGAVQRVVHQIIDEVGNDEEILLEFTTLKDFDEYTYYHSVNVAIYSIALGMRLGMDRIRLAQLGFAALFHDIGKIKLPRDLITKPTNYDEDDWAQIRRHPALGALTLGSIRSIDPEVGTAIAGAFEHHLKMDLTGYPRLSRPRTLHLFSRIISVCDAYDAMTSGRVYQKEAISPDEAVRRLLYTGRQSYDPLILKAFVHVVGIFPVGTLAKLSDGCIALVVRNDSADLYSPEVIIIRDAAGKPTRVEKRLRRRKNDPEGDQVHIVEVLDASKADISLDEFLGAIDPIGEGEALPAEAET